jgi:hypothetical protein
MGLEELADYLHMLRTCKKLTQRDLAEDMADHIRKQRIISQPNIYFKRKIHQYEYHQESLGNALEGQEPDRSLFCLYVECMGLNNYQKSKLIEKTNNPNFSLKFNYFPIYSEMGINDKYDMLSPSQRRIIDNIRGLDNPRREEIALNTIDRLNYNRLTKSYRK